MSPSRALSHSKVSGVFANPSKDLSEPSAQSSNAEEADEDIDMDDDPMEKDEDELELEKLVFGDSEGFMDGIREFRQDEIAYKSFADGDEIAEDEADEEDPGEVDDNDLFFMDSGPDAGALVPAPTAEDEISAAESDHGHGRPAWQDSDDERVTVSLASVPRLRKLREKESDDIVSGKEYIKRLRRQYVRLNPEPDWVKEARALNLKKRTRNEEDDTTSDDNIGMDSDSETRSVQPLAKLLKDADGLLRSGQPSANKRRKLHPEVLDIQRMKDLGNPAPSAISSLSMHPTLPLLLSTAGSASTLYLHHLTTSTHHTQPNAPYPLLTSLHLLHTPITTTTFSPSPSDPRIFLAARRRFFHVWNLQSGIIEKITRITGHAHEQRSMGHLKPSPTGTHIALRGTGRKGAGTVTILDATTLQWVAAARVEARGGVADFAWWRDGQGLCIAAHDGEVTEWSLADRNTVARWRDEGAVNTTVLALGGSSQDTAPLGGDRWVAVGSSSGIVNVYDRRGWVEKGEVKIPECPRPTRALEHLTTPTSVLSFAPDGQVLAVASRWKKDALRLVHLPSCTVYRNWPTGATPLGRVTAVAWGVVGGEDGGEERGELVLAVGNEAGKVRLWEVRGR